jgi:hypothetical protein
MFTEEVSHEEVLLALHCLVLVALLPYCTQLQTTTAIQAPMGLARAASPLSSTFLRIVYKRLKGDCCYTTLNHATKS